MPWNTPERKAEQALKQYFETVLGYELQGVQIATRFSNTELTEPRIEIYCEAAEPWEDLANGYTGNWKLTTQVKVVSHYATGADAVAHDEIMGNLLDNLMLVDATTGESALASEINKTLFEADLTMIIVNITARTNSVDEHSLITEQELELYVKPS